MKKKVFQFSLLLLLNLPSARLSKFSLILSNDVSDSSLNFSHLTASEKNYLLNCTQSRVAQSRVASRGTKLGKYWANLPTPIYAHCCTRGYTSVHVLHLRTRTLKFIRFLLQQ